MYSIDNIISRLRTFYFTTDMPVWLFRNSELIFSLPENFNTAHKILGSTDKAPKHIDNVNSVELTKTIFNESLIMLYREEEQCIITFGPFLNEAIEEGELTNMVRDGLIPFHQKKNMQAYYNSLKIIDDSRIHYMSLLIDNMFNKERDSNFYSSPDVKVDFYNESFTKQKGENRKNIFLHSAYSIEQEIAKHISNGDSEGAKNLLKDVNMVPHAKLASTALRSYKNSMICSCTFMTRAAIKGGANPDECFTLSDAFINKIENFVTIEELETFESFMIDSFASKVRAVKEKGYSSAILKTINYIEDHLCDELDISILGKEAYLNPSYLSNLFHKETGKTISDYIQTKRIQEAAHFVLNSNESLADIAFFYRFSSQSYFVQCFKKVMGITPGEYRKRH